MTVLRVHPRRRANRSIIVAVSDPDLPSRAEQRRDELALEAALRGLHAGHPAAEPVPHTPSSPEGRPTRVPKLLAVALLVLVAWWTVGDGGDGDEAAADRYSSPPQFTPGEGEYAFLSVHPTTSEPIDFDPCRPVRYVVNPAGAPSDWRELVTAGIAHVEWASGLDFVSAGTTTLRPFDPNRLDHALGEQPVVIGFADEAEMPGLAGNVIGLGGGVPTSWNATHGYFGTGSIALDTEAFSGPSSGRERAFLQSVVDHELGHVVGLHHVDDPRQVMQSGPGDHAYHYGPGDLEGFSILTAIPCQ